ncbi:CMGC/SRPK protein kinase [Blastomyces parvus]|uniref:non-specific serine/threonine protein kinase n=1 Tax=Blastomyces parvus TaxID=2060905 RepID=A0A2B7X6Z1_9EURO|nr:CMGC/SRPK protein kinase [Blastomyces parvus]
MPTGTGFPDLYECTIDVEDPNGYCTGRYFPVIPGSVLNSGRYRIMHKLGWGGFATIWMARDTWRDSNVALKVINMEKNAQELKILRHLQHSRVAQDNADHPGRRSVVQLVDDFDLSVSHKCLVLPVMGMDLQTRIDVEKGHRLKKENAESVARQVALGLDYLWKCGIAHGDLHSKNVLFTAPAISALSEDRIMSRFGQPVTGAVSRQDGQQCPTSMPPYLVRPISIRGNDAEVGILDLGNAFFHENPPTHLSNPWHVCAPESLYNQPLDKFVDMWSMGCLLFELITGRTFMDSFLAKRIDMITGLKGILGQPPSEWYNDLDDNVRNTLDNTRIRNMGMVRYLQLNYNHDDSQLLEDYDEEEEIPIEEYEKPPPEFTDEELMALAGILSRLLSYNPQARGTPATLFKDLSCLGNKAHVAK